MYMAYRCVVFSTKGKQEFIADKQTERDGKWDKRVMYYDIIGECASMTRKQVEKALNLAMTTWDIEIEVVFKPAWLNPGVKPDIRLDFRDAVADKYFKDSPSVLAYAYYPNQGSVSGLVVFNNDYIWGLNSNQITAKYAKDMGYPVKGNPPDEQLLRVYNIIHTLIHELGHMLGLSHDEHNDSADVMDSHYNGKLELSNWDLYRIRLKYTARIFSNWSAYARLKKAVARMKARL